MTDGVHAEVAVQNHDKYQMGTYSQRYLDGPQILWAHKIILSVEQQSLN